MSWIKYVQHPGFNTPFLIFKNTRMVEILNHFGYCIGYTTLKEVETEQTWQLGQT